MAWQGEGRVKVGQGKLDIYKRMCLASIALHFEHMLIT